jgi:hypothetical protein
MAAVIELRTGQALADEQLRSHRPAAPAPQLRVIHGGRSPVARQMRRTFLIRRLFVAVVAVLAVWMLAQVVGAAFAPLGSSTATPSPLGSVHVVEQGDTLWGLAAAVDPQADPRDVVDDIIDLNQGSAAVSADGGLRAGEELRLPAGA